jgi:hypothetical protein
MNQMTQSNTRKPLLCKYCKQVEITFSKCKVSKTGKPIPLNANSLEPHNCAQNPYNQSQLQQAQQQPQQANDLLHEILYKMEVLQAQIKELKALATYSP